MPPLFFFSLFLQRKTTDITIKVSVNRLHFKILSLYSKMGYKAQGLSTSESPTLELFSMDLESTSPEMVMRDLGRHSCWMRALALPALFTRALTTVNGSNACCVPTVMVFSLVEKLWVTSAPTAVLIKGFTI